MHADQPTIQNVLFGVIAKVRAGYVFPEVAEKVALQLEAFAVQGRYRQPTLDALCEQLTTDLRDLADDAHLRVRYCAEPHRPEAAGAVVREQNDRRLHCEAMGFGIAKVEQLARNVGYIDIRELVELPLSMTTISAAMARVARCDVLIIDLRACVGGDPATVAWLASYVFDKPVQLSTLKPRNAPDEFFWTAASVPGDRFGPTKPVLVLTAKFTFSGAEQFAYDLQALGRAKIVGEVTGGGAHACSFHWINEHINLLLPECRPVNPITSSNWEKVGVTPDFACCAAEALDVAQRIAHPLIDRSAAN
jgi:retinol-binding protein 3